MLLNEPQSKNSRELDSAQMKSIEEVAGGNSNQKNSRVVRGSNNHVIVRSSYIAKLE